MDTTAPSRIDRIKRRQAAALAGNQRATGADPDAESGKHASKRPPKAVAPNPAPMLPLGPTCVDRADIGNSDGLDLVAHIDVLGAEDLRHDFSAYLDAIADLYSYNSVDKKFIEDCFLPAGTDLVGDPIARSNVKDRIRGWQVDLITMGWVAPIGKEPMEHRARTTFRQVVMGMETDENGTPYPGMAAKQFIQAAKKSSTPRP